MDNGSLGRVLYQEPADGSVRMPYFPAVLLAGCGTFVFLTSHDLWFSLLGAIMVGGSPWALFAAIALVLHRSAVYEHGVALSVNAWTVWTGRARRFVSSGEVTRVWPVVHTWPGDPDPFLRGYEVEYPGGRGRVVRGLFGPEESQLTEAFRTMLGPRWDEVHRPLPEITPELAARIADVVSRPSRRSGGKYLAGMLLILGVIVCGAFLGQYRWRPPLPLAWSMALFAVGAMLVPPAVGLIAWDIREREAAEDAFALYLQIREHERVTGVRVLPGMPLHPDYYDTDPLGGTAPVDTGYLERGLRQRAFGILWGAAVVATAISIGAAITVMDLPAWLIVVAPLASLVFIPPCARAVAGYRGAKGHLLDRIRDEWKTKGRVLPAGFPVPPRFERLRGAARLSEAYPRRIKAAARLGPWATLLPQFVVIGAFVAGLVPFMLDVPWPLALPALVLSTAAAIVFWWWLEDGRALVDSIVEHEEATDATLPAAEPRR